MTEKPETVLAFCAHNDDQVFGAGGTLIKYAKEGKQVITIIFCYGESSHPWLKGEVTKEIRVKEAKEAQKIMGEKRLIHFGLKEKNLEKEIKEKNIKEKVKELLLHYKPLKIFTHSLDDPHPNHRAVYNLITTILSEINLRTDAYSFDIWNPITVRKRNRPKLVVDISSTFKDKLKAIYCHKSQKLSIISLLWNVYAKDFFNGLYIESRFAEVFYKIK